jgi:Kef-type K+ transport system membrane component KefB
VSSTALGFIRRIVDGVAFTGPPTGHCLVSFLLNLEHMQTTAVHRRPHSAMTDLFALSVLSLILFWAGESLRHTAGMPAVAAPLLIPGILLLLGVSAGRLAVHVGLPKLTGYIIMGAVVGPQVLGFLDKAQVDALKPVKELAIGIIALMAGCEIRTSWLRSRLWPIISIVGLQVVVVPTVLVVSSYLPGLGLPYLAADQRGAVPEFPIRLLVGVLALCSSPMVVVSVIKELKAQGPVSETAMGSAVLKDVAVLLAFSVLVAYLVSQSAGTVVAAEQAGLLASVAGQELLVIAWSLSLGLGIGWALFRITEHSRSRIGWLLVGLALSIALAEEVLHVEPLFCLLAAGFACENLYAGRSPRGTHALDQALERVALPVFVVFFLLAGLDLDLRALSSSWLPVLWFVGVRALAVWSAVRLGAMLAGSEPTVRTWCWSAMIPQAGVTLVLVFVVADQFEGWGGRLKDVVIAAVALHELIGPVLLSAALRRSGEVAAPSFKS